MVYGGAEHGECQFCGHPITVEARKRHADKLREKAREAYRRSAESFERSDTDGFLSQWASDLTGRKYQIEAELVENGGKSEFRGLFNEDGQRIRAKLVKGRDYWGNPEQKWIVLNEQDQVMHWVNIPSNTEEPSKRSKMGQLGLHEEWEMAPARAEIIGTSMVSCFAGTVRTDGGYPAYAIVYEEG